MKSKTQSVDDINKHIDDFEDDESQQYDLSILRKPILTAITGFLEARKAYEGGTEEIRKLLSNECDLMYECKVCRNIFRSLTNFISHKRVYCRKLFNTSTHFHFKNDGFIDHDISTIIQAEQNFSYQSKNKKSQEELINKDLSSIVERLKRKQHKNTEIKLTDYYDKINHKLTQDDVSRKNHVLQLDSVPDSSAAVYQTLKNNDTDNIMEEVNEVNSLLLDINTVLGPDGKILPATEMISDVPPILFPNEDSVDSVNSSSSTVRCQICNLQFNTVKTLQLHLEMKHIPSTYVYPCPSCPQTFLQPNLVIRHLSNDHKKSNRRIRLMRDTIFKKRTRIDEVIVKGPSRELAKLQSNHEQQEAAAKAWMENLEHFDKGPMCAYCGKSFDRKARLDTHITSCAQKSRNEKKIISQKAKDDEITVTKSMNSIKLEPETSDENSSLSGIQQNNDEIIQSNLHNSLNKSSAEDEEEMNIKQELVVNDEPLNKRKRKRTKIALRNDNDEIYWSMDDTNEEKLVVDTSLVKKEVEIQKAEEKPKVRRRRTKKIKIEPDYEDELEDTAGNGEVKVTCRTCKKEFETKSLYKYHVKTFHNRQKRFWCSQCDYKGYRRVDTIHHLKSIHNYDGDLENINTMIIFKNETKPKKPAVDEKILSDNLNSVIESVSRNCSDESAVFETITELESTLNSTLTNTIKMEAEEIKIEEVPIETPPKKRGRPKLKPDMIAVKEEPQDIEKTIKKSKIIKRINPPPVVKEEKPEEPIPKRPIRNRVKPVNKDFVYDLSNLLTKDSELIDFGMPELISMKQAKRKTSLSSLDDDKKAASTLAKNVDITQRYSISVVKGAALAMAQVEVAGCLACFSKPPEIPRERPSIPKSPIRLQQETIPIQNWPVIKKSRNIGSIVKDKNVDIKVKRKYKKRIPLSEEFVTMKKSKKQLLENDKFDPIKRYSIMQKFPQTKDEFQEPSTVSIASQVLETLAAGSPTLSPPESSSSMPTDAVINAKRITLMQRLAENKSKKQQKMKKKKTSQDLNADESANGHKSRGSVVGFKTKPKAKAKPTAKMKAGIFSARKSK